MSLLDNASLLLTPNAYKEGKLYSVIPTNGNGDFTATRATTATRVNSSGLVDLVPYNLLQRSEEFENAAWSVNTATVTPNTVISPSGLMNADTITNISGSLIGQNPSLATIGQMYTFSIYIKRINGNGLINLVDINGNLVPITITNEWERYSVTATASSTSLRAYFRVMVAGDSIAAWGAQLVEGTSARDYLRTETRLNIPRVDYSLGGCPNILLEPQRTNIATFSDDFSNAIWQKFTGVSVNVNTSNSPSGTLTADTIIGATGAVAWTGVNTLGRSVSSLSSSTTYTFSVYLKGSGSVTTTLRDQTTGNLTSLVCNLTSSWQRFELTRTTGAATTALGIIFSNATGNFDVWGAQLEAGAYATSYIPTTTASVTRNADSITRNNIFTNGLITASGGTWFVELRNNRVLARDGSGGILLGTATSAFSGDNLFIANWLTTNRIVIVKRIGGTSTVLFITTTDTCKIAIKWNGSTADVFQNGVKVVSATAFNATALENMVGSFGAPAFINEMALLPTPLTDDQLIELTTL